MMTTHLVRLASIAAIVAPVVTHGDARQAATPASQLPRFEVASVKPNNSGPGKTLIQTLPGGRFVAINMTLRALALFAYGLQPSQLTGGPDWFDADRFDIVAKADANIADQFSAEKRGEPSPAQLMLRGLLADDFKLVSHTESREMPIYALVRARADKPGPELRPSTTPCSTAPASPRTGAAATGGNPCGIRIGRGPGTMVGGGATMRQLANTLTTWVGRIVTDGTGLSGDFDFMLTWTPEQMPQGFDQKVAAGGLAPPDPNGPSIFTAVQEQLGLKLDSRKGPVEVLVVDRAQRPTGTP